MKVRREEDPAGGQCETNRAQSKAFLLAEGVGDRPSCGASNNAPNESTARCPSDPRRVQMKQLTEIPDGAADDDVVVSEKKTTQGRYAGCDDQRSSRVG